MTGGEADECLAALLGSALAVSYQAIGHWVDARRFPGAGFLLLCAPAAPLASLALKRVVGLFGCDSAALRLGVETPIESSRLITTAVSCRQFR